MKLCYLDPTACGFNLKEKSGKALLSSLYSICGTKYKSDAQGKKIYITDRLLLGGIQNISFTTLPILHVSPKQVC